MPTVTHVRKERSASGTHQHIAGVCTAEGTYYTRAQVVAGLRRNETWRTSAGRLSAAIREIRQCQYPGCSETPYITTDADSSRADNLDNLPPC